MGNNPDTRLSLILRLEDPGDACAWEDFVHIYESMIYRYGLRRGLQEANARELVQEVLLGIAKSIAEWNQNRKPNEKFRTWLSQLIRYEFNKPQRRKQFEFGQASSVWLKIDSQYSHKQERQRIKEEDQADLRKATIQWAFAIVKEKVQPQTWEAFKLSSIDNLPIPKVAEKTGLTTDQVYVARSRVIKRIQKTVTELELEGPQ